MNLNEYQAQIEQFDQFPASDNPTNPGFMAKLLGLSGEAGEVAEKFKKIIRDQNGQITPENKAEIQKELGDVLWYLATIARYLDIPLEDIAITNIEKLSSRQSRGKINGSGDNR